MATRSVTRSLRWSGASALNPWAAPRSAGNDVLALALLIVAGTLRLPVPVPVALVQLNLKLPAEVIARWRAAAEAAGERSVRDWLVKITTAGPGADPAAAPGLEARLAALEKQVATLAGDRDFASAPLSARAESIPHPGEPVSPARVKREVNAGGEVITTPEVARLLGMKTNTLTERIRRRHGGIGFEESGWRITSRATPPTGGPPQWLWERL